MDSSSGALLPDADSLKSCFPPVVGEQTRVLLLGSLPGEVSLAQSQYYAHPRNQFWLLMGQVIDQPIAQMAYEEKLQCLQKAGVGLWDVIGKAQRRGSLDSALRNRQTNDVLGLAESLPHLRVIAFNGMEAFRAASQLEGRRWDMLSLPSSSPAYTLSMARKLDVWLQLRRYL